MDRREVLEKEYLVARMLGSSPVASRFCLGNRRGDREKKYSKFRLGLAVRPVTWFQNGAEDGGTGERTFTGAGPEKGRCRMFLEKTRYFEVR